jgi:ATP-binding cassette subfamily B protein
MSHNVTFKVSKGEMASLLGESGSGKSTLLQILLEFYSTESGTIMYNDRRIDELLTPVWRIKIGVVLQDVKIFNGSLLYNIALNDLKEDHDSAIKFCQNSGLSAYFESLPQRYSSVIGEAGINLSGGQKQLVGIIRALWRMSEFLVLDEPTAAMDRKMEEVVLETLLRLKT